MQLIRETALNYNSPNDSMGYGIPDFKALHNKLLREKGLIYQQENLPLVYPNPFNNYLDIMFYTNSAKEYEISLFDHNGKLHYSNKQYFQPEFFANFKITGLEMLSNGIYYVKIRSAQLNKTFRLAKF